MSSSSTIVTEGHPSKKHPFLYFLQERKLRFENFYVIGAKQHNAENLHQEVNTAKKILCHIGIRLVGDKLAVCYSAVSTLHPPNLELFLLWPLPPKLSS